MTGRAIDSHAADRLGELYGILERSEANVEKIRAINERTRFYIRLQIAAVSVQVASLVVIVAVTR